MTEYLQNTSFFAGTRKVYFYNRYKDISWKSKMENVVKYYVYLDILLMGSIYVIKSTFLRGNPISGKQKIFKSAAQL